MSAVQKANLPSVGVGREIVRAPATRSAGASVSARPTAATGYSVPFDRLLGRSLNSRQTGTTARSSGGVRPSGAAPASAAPYRSLVESTARRYGLDPALLLGIVDSESGFDPSAVSSAGAKGLMQLMDGTARSLGVKDPYSPEQSLDGGARYLRDMLSRYGGSVPLALAAYNAGPGNVDRHGGVPPFQETQSYVSRVLASAKRYGGASGAGA